MTAAAVAAPGPYPVNIAIEPAIDGRNRLTVGFRFILAIPHQIIVGATNVGSSGVLGTVAFVCAVISWFAIVFTGAEPRGLWDLRHFYLRWRLRVQAYVFLLRDEYPPFGDGDYPATLVLDWPEPPRNRVSVGLRLLYAIPQIVVTVVLVVAALVCAIISWFANPLHRPHPRGPGELHAQRPALVDARGGLHPPHA